MSSTTANSLNVSNIDYSFGRKTVLENIQIEVPNGKFVALLGQNGAGKTTLFSIITGLYAAHGGAVSIGGHDLRANTQAALGDIGVVFQRATLDRDLTVQQNLRYFCNLHGISKTDAYQRIQTALENYDLSDLLKSKVSSLSGGQQRRVELARATLHNPKFLLLDEPTVGLDHANRMEFVANVKRLCKQRNVGVLWATHLMDEVEDADYIYILHHGEMKYEGVSNELLEIHKKNSITELYSHLTEKTTEAAAQ